MSGTLLPREPDVLCTQGHCSPKHTVLHFPEHDCFKPHKLGPNKHLEPLRHLISNTPHYSVRGRYDFPVL